MKTLTIPRSAVAVVEAGGHYILEDRPNEPGVSCPGMVGLPGGGANDGEGSMATILREVIDEELEVPGDSACVERLDQVWQGLVTGPSGRVRDVSLFVLGLACSPNEVRLRPNLLRTGTGLKIYRLGIYPPDNTATTFTRIAAKAHFNRTYHKIGSRVIVPRPVVIAGASAA